MKKHMQKSAVFYTTIVGDVLIRRIVKKNDLLLYLALGHGGLKIKRKQTVRGVKKLTNP